MDNPIYVHYGNTHFDPGKSFPIENSEWFTKPRGGLWASRKDATFGWKQWCEQEDFRACDNAVSFQFVMRDPSKVYTIHNLEDLNTLPHIPRLPPFALYANSSTHYIDFEACLNAGYDAIELCWYGQEFKDKASGDLYFALCAWDCDSIVVLNPNAVITIQS